MLRHGDRCPVFIDAVEQLVDAAAERLGHSDQLTRRDPVGSRLVLLHLLKREPKLQAEGFLRHAEQVADATDVAANVAWHVNGVFLTLCGDDY